jgi:hypothetical protein
MAPRLFGCPATDTSNVPFVQGAARPVAQALTARGCRGASAWGACSHSCAASCTQGSCSDWLSAIGSQGRTCARVGGLPQSPLIVHAGTVCGRRAGPAWPLSHAASATSGPCRPGLTANTRLLASLSGRLLACVVARRHMRLSRLRVRLAQPGTNAVMCCRHVPPPSCIISHFQGLGRRLHGPCFALHQQSTQQAALPSAVSRGVRRAGSMCSRQTLRACGCSPSLDGLSHRKGGLQQSLLHGFKGGLSSGAETAFEAVRQTLLGARPRETGQGLASTRQPLASGAHNSREHALSCSSPHTTPPAVLACTDTAAVLLSGLQARRLFCMRRHILLLPAAAPEHCDSL